MKDYKKPMIINMGTAEGVYLASGAVESSECWTIDAYIHQTPETGRHDYRLQVDCFHSNADHHVSTFIATFTFNKEVVIKHAGNATTVVGTGTTVSVKGGPGTSNPNESFGFGDFQVTADEGLELISVGIQCTGK